MVFDYSEFLRHCKASLVTPKWKSNFEDMKSAAYQVFWAVQLMCSRSTASDQRLEHGAHNNTFHVLCCRLVVHCGKVIPKSSLVCEIQVQASTLVKNVFKKMAER